MSGSALVSDRLRLWFGSARQALDRPRRPTSPLGDLGLLLFDEIADRLIAIKTAEDLHRHAPVRGAAAVLEYDVEQDGASILRK